MSSGLYYNDFYDIIDVKLSPAVLAAEYWNTRSVLGPALAFTSSEIYLICPKRLFYATCSNRLSPRSLLYFLSPFTLSPLSLSAELNCLLSFTSSLSLSLSTCYILPNNTSHCFIFKCAICFPYLYVRKYVEPATRHVVVNICPAAGRGTDRFTSAQGPPVI